MADELTQHSGWHLKKEVPIATILAIIVTMFTATVFIIGLRADLDELTKDVGEHILMDKEARAEDRSMYKLILTKLDAIQKEVSEMKEEQAFRYGKVLGSGILNKLEGE